MPCNWPVRNWESRSMKKQGLRPSVASQVGCIVGAARNAGTSFEPALHRTSKSSFRVEKITFFKCPAGQAGS
jgi:hypothetical protein